MKPVDPHLVLCFLETDWVPLLYGEPPVIGAAVGIGAPAGTEDSGDEPVPEPEAPLAGDSPGDDPLGPEPGAPLAGDSPGDEPVGAAPEPAVYDGRQRKESKICYGTTNSPQ